MPTATPAGISVVVTLTPREVEILDLVSRPGGSRKGAAAALGISRHTVDHHLTIAYAKLGVDSIGAAARRLGQLERGAIA
jgi:DNA-binding CsgD family transcriptional regulator